MVAPPHMIGFEACHIFPYDRESEWNTRRFGTTVVDDNAPTSKIGQSKIHSPQNGILLEGGIHTLFDAYIVADNYKVTCFTEDSHNVDGRTLGFQCRDPNNPLRVKDDLLRWHFRTSVSAIMRGAGEKPWEYDFPEGEDIDEIISGPHPEERMELELHHRLGVSS
ncbi:predicted protein [Uncinocarpus reesii 1704]|uniref:HNH nuclease domain-containing protein n=1 Tax=Uncinocarpus reesii (strain UAMH 1704) TaxID=336963 RepID=C4JQK2_UNCRE|nr:uncharacterized protein UREG_03347 [Uncinocarpus reesii 1704]EEP78501.1 predicted protein [Uncinocarpus reesii 1704]